MSSSNKDSIELSLLGISSESLPTEDNMPLKFNRLAGPTLWKQVCRSPQFKRILSSPHKSHTDVWLWCVRNYLRLCRSKGVFPFQNSTQQNHSDGVYRSLVHARRALVQYFETNRLFYKVTVLRTSRSYRFSDKDFWVFTKAYLGPLEDPTFARWLTSHTPLPMFSATGQGGVYSRRLVDLSGVLVELEFDLSFPVRPVLRLAIRCPSPITFSHTGDLLSGDQITRYVENYVWIPLIRAFRIQHTNNRLL